MAVRLIQFLFPVWIDDVLGKADRHVCLGIRCREGAFMKTLLRIDSSPMVTKSISAPDREFVRNWSEPTPLEG